MDGWMTAIVRPFQQNLSHIRTMGRLKKAACNGTSFTVGEMSASSGTLTRDR